MAVAIAAVNDDSTSSRLQKMKGLQAGKLGAVDAQRAQERRSWSALGLSSCIRASRGNPEQRTTMPAPTLQSLRP